jgi:hypothetical protein
MPIQVEHEWHIVALSKWLDASGLLDVNASA